ncbi:MAG: DUF2764 domain-containing protein [Lentimicrobiaceae bacterium]|jgi:hypothetical protein|nr:DUF2764 domain-containing protein [Lentimicrobiaceae bacterium]
MKYYAFIAGLPDLLFEEHKKVYTTEAFKQELDQLLHSSDKKLIEKLFLKYDNENILSLFRKGEQEMTFNKLAIYSKEEIVEMVEVVKDEDRKWDRKYPAYLEVFIREYLAEEQENPNIFWEDRIAGLYYDYLGKTSNKFVREWAEMHVNYRNALTALSCRRNQIAYKHLIVGNNEVAHILREFSNPNLSDYIENYEFIREINEMTDLIGREQYLDQQFWSWIDEKNTFHYFDIENIIGYLFKLQIIERWQNLNKEKGAKLFKELIYNLKKGVQTIEKF